MIRLVASEVAVAAFNVGMFSDRIVSYAKVARAEGAPGIFYDAGQLKVAKQCVAILGSVADQNSFNATQGAARRLADLFDGLPMTDSDQGSMSVERAEQIGFSLYQISTTLSDELHACYFAKVGSAHAPYMEDGVSVFGETVDTKFPKAIEDISEAAKCLALGRHTACVFHLMRVMEHCVHRLGVKLKVNADVKTDTWYKIANDINNAVHAMPGKTAPQAAKKQRYALAYSNLNGVRMAWRNDVMHPKATYTEEEAANIFSHVGAFLQSLVPLV